MSTRIPRRLDPVEIRVLGSLLEKEQATPEAYPLTLNALLSACNQRTNREPVMELGEAEVSAALDRLRQEVLVWRTETSRSERWKQSVERRWELDPASKALLTLLLLRGPQTPGELRSRCDRLHPFSSLSAVEGVLQRLAAAPEPLVRELGRRPGQKETRWAHLVGDAAPGDPALEPTGWAASPPAGLIGKPPASSGGTPHGGAGGTPHGGGGGTPHGGVMASPPAGLIGTPHGGAAPSSLASRVERLEELVARLDADLEELRRQLS